ncbi:MAG TPA: bifunctional methylenetetrahydrofolate dehydrogenase/methenyltetrahydrofolate cyclohydrolase FolD [Xanthobacteraceae bacterium]|jgi:methylenetetrahydrofolate dehydrogenase (NADP+)/methenyltetrahydrofolate cyclohydrolase|nr:bifunctional methylenetetrahydrofolate dehydrogenase/methenyltetrahydrofolate cyclohydrolase FolD [Xanthobacteraceae bacterium]
MLVTRRIDGKARAARLVADVTAAASALKAGSGIVPGLCAVLVGTDPASQSYVGSKGKAAIAAGIESFQHRLPETTSEAALLALIDQLNADDRIDGILVQLPLPKHIDPQRVIDAVDPAKDVDGFHVQNVGRLWSGGQGRALVPCTPYGCLLLLKETVPDLTGAEAVVLGRSNIVGKPMAALLLAENCTVTLVHSRSRDIPEVVRRADILVAAVGRPEFVRGDWIKPGAVVIDVGFNRVPAAGGGSKAVGDVAFAEAQGIAAAITPVPGGVGPMTIACLLRNTLIAACRRRGQAVPGV